MNDWPNFFHDATAEQLDEAATVIGLIRFSESQNSNFP